MKKIKGEKTGNEVIQDESEQPTTCGGETLVDQQDQQDDADVRLKIIEKKDKKDQKSIFGLNTLNEMLFIMLLVSVYPQKDVLCI